MQVGRQPATNPYAANRNDEPVASGPAAAGNPRKQRQEILKIAGAVEGELRTLKGFGMFTTKVDKLDGILGRLKSHDERLNALQSNRLDETDPHLSVVGKAANATLIAMAVPTRVAATVAAGVLAVPLTCVCQPVATASVFHTIDQLPKARARAQRKAMSTASMADTVAKSLRKATEKAVDKRKGAAFFAGAPAELMNVARATQAELHQTANAARRNV